MPHYMVELVLARRAVLVVGGGQVARRKIEGLLACHAQVTVVAPELDPQVAAWVASGEVACWPERFRAGLLERKPLPFLVFAATGAADLNREVARVCHERGILCNSADDPASSGFLVPAVVRRGRVSVAVGTGGLSPALSRVLKERIDDWLEPGWGALAERFGAWRARVTAAIPEAVRRQQFWRASAQAAVREGCLNGTDHDAWLQRRLEETQKKQE